MNLENLKSILKDEPKFRYKQLSEAIYKKMIKSWSEASNIPKALIEKLQNNCPIEIDGNIIESKILTGKKQSGTLKALIKLHDSLEIETVLMMHPDGRNTVCVSSQVGCPLACSFCATGEMGYRRNLNSSEIVEQVLFFARYLKDNFNEERFVTNIVFMGMGEPMLNYENVWRAISIFNDKEKFNIGARKISISTVGIVRGIKKMTKEKLQVNLAISLHAPNEKLRTSLIPSNKNNSLKEILKIVDTYIQKTGRQVMFEYVMIDGVNDSIKNARELADLMNKPLCMVNIIPLNQTERFKASSRDRIDKFKKILLGKKIKVSERFSYGGDIAAACGQLSRKKLKLNG
jgi:23S rRNA (adenine2503-C2)-methyltransferase